ncbi:PREDICTED: serine hydroxymethyltransferase 2, mitochondrial-like [Nelumbo nucifera]|uniref:Serine hydroxymethyltransferase 2, mitochondrial-like n=1 Tax=Nelumbo nucifera TaxID=4432 RepID=A0A1U8Q6V4_NELNU|nr:PREDICTED: serine hydroxymethyltransferase 2, mitochondrial-like [Nelumbo nucifera]
MVLLDGQVPMHYMVASLVIVPLSVRLSSSRITGVKAQVGRIESIASCHVGARYCYWRFKALGRNSSFAFISLTLKHWLLWVEVVVMVLYDYEDKINQVVFQGLQGGPHNHTIAGLAVALRPQLQSTKPIKNKFLEIAQNCEGLVNFFSAQILQSLVEKGYELVSGGTENHLVLVNLKNKHKMRMHEHHRTSVLQGIDVSRVEKVLELVHIAANKNTVLGDVSAIVLGSNRMDKVPFLN